MSTTACEIEKWALTMPPADRVALAERLLASVDSFATPEIEAAWREEIAVRVSDIESGNEPGLSAARALAAARKAVNETRRIPSARRSRAR